MDTRPPHVAADPARLRATASEYEAVQKHDLAALIRQVADEVERSLGTAHPDPDRAPSAT